jgi:hypothetical protein
MFSEAQDSGAWGRGKMTHCVMLGVKEAFLWGWTQTRNEKTHLHPTLKSKPGILVRLAALVRYLVALQVAGPALRYLVPGPYLVRLQLTGVIYIARSIAERL